MELNEFQTKAQKYAMPDNPMTEAVYGLLEEAGEVAGKFKRRDRGDYMKKAEALPDRGMRTAFDLHMDEHSLFVEDLRKELGDLMWYIARVAETNGISLESIARGNLEKLEDRWQRNQIQGSGDHR